ncbi:MAG: hypothetical protein K2G35_03500 [Duncaniella sp.]|nr:hypothetical protein [Duncaniella sp.]
MGCCKDKKGCPRGNLQCFNYLEDIPGGYADFDIVEVQFKNTRKGYYRCPPELEVAKGDMVAVEAQPGHDIGQITMTGKLVQLQMKRAGIKNEAEIRKVFRLARPADLEKYEEAKARENDTMIRARKIADSLHLNMKIGDVEYQGDGNKAIFYYIADERVDFRQLIKVLADTFKVRIEMKQIGARQEAGRIGGIGSCGRPLCCALWMTNFVSVGTAAARYQDISLNPQKLAGQCAKLKCCLNFEVDAYMESVKQLPPREVRLETADATWFHFKTDIFKKEITYSSEKNMAANLVTIDAARVFEIIEMNRRGERPLQLLRDSDVEAKANATAKAKPIDLAAQDDLTRFDKSKKKKKKKSKAQGAPAGADATNASAPEQKAAEQKADAPDRQQQRKQRDRKEKAQGGEGNQKAPKTAGEPQGNRQPKGDRPDRQRQKKRQPSADKPKTPQQPQQPSQPQPAPARLPKAFRGEE